LEFRQLKKINSGARVIRTLSAELQSQSELALLNSYKRKSLLFPTPAHQARLYQNVNLLSEGACMNFLSAQQLYTPLAGLSSSGYQALTFTFNSFLVITYPVLLNIRFQQKFNIFFFYMIRSTRGISLKLGKPLRRKTRARTYLSMY
jgi:hypothetical protein